MISLLNIYPIPINVVGKLAIISRPYGYDRLDESIESLKDGGIDVVISALAQDEILELDLGLEKEICEKYKIQFLSFTIQDRGVPLSYQSMKKFCESVSYKIQEGLSIGIHCRAGIGRSSMIASCILLDLGIGIQEGIELISKSRRVRVPDTEEQMNWLYEYEKIRIFL